MKIKGHPQVEKSKIGFCLKMDNITWAQFSAADKLFSQK